MHINVRMEYDDESRERIYIVICRLNADQQFTIHFSSERESEHEKLDNSITNRMAGEVGDCCMHDGWFCD